MISRRSYLQRGAPPRRKRSRPRKGRVHDEAYLEFIRQHPCAICALPWRLEVSGVAFSNVQQTRTEAAHVGARGLGQKCSDRETIPLCGEAHHRLGVHSAHVMGKKFWTYWGINRDALIAYLNQQYEAERLAAA